MNRARASRGSNLLCLSIMQMSLHGVRVRVIAGPQVGNLFDTSPASKLRMAPALRCRAAARLHSSESMRSPRRRLG